MGEPAGAPVDTGGDKTSPSSGLSEFLGRVLEQLSLASWLPAVMLVGNLAVLLELRSQHSTDVGAAVNKLTASPLGIAIVFLFAVLLAAIVTQAFEFETIRLLEGYVSSLRGPVPRVVAKRLRAHGRKRARIEQQLKTREYRAFIDARGVMLALPTASNGTAAFPQELLDAIERIVQNTGHPDGTDSALIDAAEAVDWTLYVDAATLYELDALDARLAIYPARHRVLPTRLGNVLRAAEDRVTLKPGENLEGFVIRHHAHLPENIRNEHHDYRTRLDMYSSLVLVFVVLAGTGGGLLAFASLWVPLTLAAVYLLLGGVAYEATVASARGYGHVLREIDTAVRREGLSTAGG